MEGEVLKTKNIPYTITLQDTTETFPQLLQTKHHINLAITIYI